MGYSPSLGFPGRYAHGCSYKYCKISLEALLRPSSEVIFRNLSGIRAPMGIQMRDTMLSTGVGCTSPIRLVTRPGQSTRPPRFRAIPWLRAAARRTGTRCQQEPDRMWLTEMLPKWEAGLLLAAKRRPHFHGPREPLVDNPESVFRRDGRQSCVVAKNLVDAVLADEREQVFIDIPKLDLGRVLLPNNDDAVIGFIVADRADRVVPKIR
jgi:hypothetical protein